MSGSVSLVNGHIDKDTNFDRIKKMSVEEMAEWLVWFTKEQINSLKVVPFKYNETNFKKALVEWLESEVETE
jgi:hypothetical protein